MIHQFFITGNQRFPAPLLTVNLSTYQLINLSTYHLIRGRLTPPSTPLHRDAHIQILICADPTARNGK